MVRDLHNPAPSCCFRRRNRIFKNDRRALNVIRGMRRTGKRDVTRVLTLLPGDVIPGSKQITPIRKKKRFAISSREGTANPYHPAPDQNGFPILVCLWLRGPVRSSEPARFHAEFMVKMFAEMTLRFIADQHGYFIYFITAVG